MRCDEIDLVFFSAHVAPSWRIKEEQPHRTLQAHAVLPATLTHDHKRQEPAILLYTQPGIICKLPYINSDAQNNSHLDRKEILTFVTIELIK